MDQESSILTGREVLIGVTSLAAVVIFGCSIRLSHRHGDRCRSAFLYLRIALCVFFVSRLFDLSAFIVSNVGGNSPSKMSSLSLSAANAIFGLTGAHMLLTEFTDVLILVVLLHLCIGICLAHSNELGPMERRIKRGIPFMGALLALIAVGNVTATISYFTVSTSSPMYGMTMAFQVCLCVASLLIGTWAIRIKLKTRGVTHLNQATIFLLVCSFLYVVCTGYGVLTNANPSTSSRLIFLNLIDVIFSTWPEFIILCLVFAISTKKQPNGLWTGVEPEMTARADEPPDTPWSKSTDFAQYSASPTLMMYDPHTGKTWEVQNPLPYHPVQELEQPAPVPPQEMFANFPELPSPQSPCPVAEIPTSPIMLPNTVAGTSQQMQREEEKEDAAKTQTQNGPIACNIKLALRRGMDYF